MSLEIGTIRDVTFLYDFSPNRNTWSQTGLVKLFMPKVEESKYKVTEEIMVSSIDSHVDHPLFGNTKRYGWAAMRNSNEYSFSIAYCNTKQ